MTLWRSQNNFNRSYFILFYFLSRTVRGFNLISPSIPEPHQKKVSQCSQIFFADWSACFSHTTHPEWEWTFCLFLRLETWAFSRCISYLDSLHTISPGVRASEVFSPWERWWHFSWQEASMTLNTLLSLFMSRKLIYLNQVFVLCAPYNSFT